MKTLLIKNTDKGDIFIENGIIEEIGKISKQADKIIDASGLIVLPAFIDLHVHFREPGYEYKEDIETGSKSASFGGFWAVCTMPNTNPPIDKPELVIYQINRAREVDLVDIFPIACATKNREGKEMAEYYLLHKSGSVGFSDDGNCIYNTSVLRNALIYLKMFDLPIIQHAEDGNLSLNYATGWSFDALRDGLLGIPESAEVSIIARDCILALETGGWIHFSHVSSKLSVEIIRLFKKLGARITADTTPHHLVLDSSYIKENNYSPNFKMYPPLRTKEDIESLWQGLIDGTIDAIASDHAPHEFESKLDFIESERGIIGLQTAFSLVYSEAIKRGLDIDFLIEKFVSFPTRFLKLRNTGEIKKGYRANLVLFDKDREWIFSENLIISKSKNSPFINWKFKGKVVLTMKDGKITYSEIE
ncbi:MAG: dihydroorotase [candidate division WOR-3 bacterium]|nr:dihydroorotase [candidate division WOR-3 bacterium]MCX7947749.1 dihydroorotase [candidate division WOR-3 bacterium]MDW8150328.1 dihydroorotase [candidate division WOR-3 bacterium]